MTVGRGMSHSYGIDQGEIVTVLSNVGMTL